MRPFLVMRALAIAIALLGAIDPAITSTRTTRPEVVIIAANPSREADLAARVTGELGDRFTVIPASFAAAAATVIIGDALPASASEIPVPVFVVARDARAVAATIESVGAPARATLDARVPITVALRVRGGAGRRLEATLHSGDLVVDRVTRAIATNDDRHALALSFLPTAIGATPLRVAARIAGASADSAVADLVIDVRDERWAVLFFDLRPSWLSTFVRRGVERDPRFVVTSRVVTSRGISVDAGRPPGTLGDVETLSLFDAVVIGAPDALTDRDASGLDRYLRRRGGSVVLLHDEDMRGAVDRLTQVRQWSSATNAAGFAVMPIDGDSAGLRATSLAWPSTRPLGAPPLALSRASGDTAVAGRPVVWRSAVGAGQLIVSGALDAWRYRDPARSGFDAFWRGVVAGAASAGSTALEIMPGSIIVAPGEPIDASATLRSIALAEPTANRPLRAIVSGTIDTPDSATVVRFWPDDAPGSLRASFRAPPTPGIYRMRVGSDGLRADVPLLVTHTPAPGDHPDIVAAWVASRGGRTFSGETLDALSEAVEDAAHPAARITTWHPMRSAWWIVPFALLLGAEWLARRRNGLA